LDGYFSGRAHFEKRLLASSTSCGDSLKFEESFGFDANSWDSLLVSLFGVAIKPWLKNVLLSKTWYRPTI